MRFLRRHVFVLAAPAIALAAVSAASCIASAPHGIERVTDDDAGPGSSLGLGGGSATPDAQAPDAPSIDPHALYGANPSHGSFNGGQRVLLSGNGFGSNVRVWFGATEVDPSVTVAVSPTEVQVNAPPGTAGPVDLAAQNGDDASTRRTLESGYVYDALYAQPNSGPISGGDVIELIGQGTAWDATTVAKIDQKPCTTLRVDSPTMLACTLPQGTPGSKTISVTTGAETILVLDGYTYQDSDNGFKGGLSGAPLAGMLKVLAYDDFTGDAIGAAYAIAGDDLTTALVKQTDASGVATFSDPSLTGHVTVTVAAKCHSPISFVDVPVDTVTVYLDPTLDPTCGGSGDPPPVGGKPQDEGIISGELVWGTIDEFERGPWNNVPTPVGPKEQQAAYVFLASGDPTAPFALPDPSEATRADATGTVGYAYAMYAPAGNHALYAIAGIEDTSVTPRRFTAYAMGVVHGVPAAPTVTTPDVFISMASTLDQALTMDVTAPISGPKGPDRLLATVAVELGNDGFAILPAGQQTPLLPLQGALSFVGVPSLGGFLFGSTFYATARAVTGAGFAAPMSVIGQMLATTTSQPVVASGFVGVPTLTTPAFNAAWDGRHLATTFPATTAPIDFTEYQIVSGNGLVTWTVVVPAASNSVALPDLSGFQQAGVTPGPVTIAVYGAHVVGFDYTNFPYRDLQPANMTAYSLDDFNAHFAP